MHWELKLERSDTWRKYVVCVCDEFFFMVAIVESKFCKFIYGVANVSLLNKIKNLKIIVEIISVKLLN